MPRQDRAAARFSLRDSNTSGIGGKRKWLTRAQSVILLVTTTTLSAALVIDNILNGLARPFFGWISDLIGREITVGVVFTIGAFAYWGLGALGHTPYAFIVLAGLVFSRGAKSSACFPRSRPILMAQHTPRPMRVCSTPQRGWRCGWCH
jgi:MFS family permease